jgi:RND family efflux transporter MFP subunit
MQWCYLEPLVKNTKTSKSVCRFIPQSLSICRKVSESVNFKTDILGTALWKPSAIALIFPLLMTACSRQHPEMTSSPLPVKTFQLGSEPSQPSDRFPISIARDRESNVAFRVGGTIQELQVRAGQWVEAGQVLGSIKATTYTSNRVRAESELHKLKHAVLRNTELLNAGAIATNTKEDTEDALAAAEATLASAQYDEDSSFIKAPFRGIVLLRDAEVGETVAAGQRIVRISDSGSPVIAKSYIPAQVAKNLRTGGAAHIQIADSWFEASIRYIGALSDPRTGTVTVELWVPKASSVASGVTGSVEFKQTASIKDTSHALLPPEALLESSGGVGSVYVLDAKNSVAKRTAIRVLGFDGEMIRISGLDQGVKVITTGAGFVTDGQKVQEIYP